MLQQVLPHILPIQMLPLPHFLMLQLQVWAQVLQIITVAWLQQIMPLVLPLKQIAVQHNFQLTTQPQLQPLLQVLMFGLELIHLGIRPQIGKFILQVAPIRFQPQFLLLQSM